MPNYAFIDSQNLNLSIRDQGWKLDFKQFYYYLRDKHHVSRVFIFIGYINGNQKLYTFFQKIGYIVIFKPTIELSDGKVKGNVDAELVLYTMIEINHYDKAIIISGDGDFYCLAEYLKDHNKLLKLMVPNQYKYSSLLKRFSKDIVFINQLRKRVEFLNNKNEGH